MNRRNEWIAWLPVIGSAVLALVLSTLAMLEVLRDPYTDSWWPWIGMGAPAVFGFVWITAPVGRLFIPSSLALVVVGAGVHLVIGYAPAGRAAAVSTDYRVDGRWDLLGDVLLNFDLLGFVASLFGGVAALLIGLPILALRAPQAAESALPVPDGNPVSRSRAALLGLFVVLLLTFAIPTLLVTASETGSSALRAVGLALIPVGLAALGVTMWGQRAEGLRRSMADSERTPRS